ncbi:MAG: hypothetical protein JSS60_00530 [Verrucomicrobia bacterium]|nr:hypothetical protein [Verrucomicrobiota bacterium]
MAFNLDVEKKDPLAFSPSQTISSGAAPASMELLVRNSLEGLSTTSPQRTLEAVAVATPKMTLESDHSIELLSTFERSLNKGGAEKKKWDEECNQVFLKTHFDPAIAKTSQFQRLVDEHGLAIVSLSVQRIEMQVKDALREDEFIIHGLAMIEHALKEGDRFSGVPELCGFEKDNTPLIAWRKDAHLASSLVEDGLHFSSRSIQQAVAQKPKKAQFDNIEEMKAAFNYFKRTLPTGFLEDGCDMRCIWISYILENCFKVGYEKVKVSHSRGALFEVKPPFAEGKVKWTMHTAPVVMCAGKKYIFDVSLSEPIEYEQWLSSLHPKREEMKIEASSRWDVECRSGDNGQSFNFNTVKEDLRGLYLFEYVDDNCVATKVNIRRTNGWMSWVKSERGFAPIGAQTLKKDPKGRTIIRPVVMGVQPVGDGKYCPVIENIPVRAEFFEGKDGQYYIDESTQRKFQLLFRNGRLVNTKY